MSQLVIELLITYISQTISLLAHVVWVFSETNIYEEFHSSFLNKPYFHKLKYWKSMRKLYFYIEVAIALICKPVYCVYRVIMYSTIIIQVKSRVAQSCTFSVLSSFVESLVQNARSNTFCLESGTWLCYYWSLGS